MDDERWVRKMYMWNMKVNKWARRCCALVRKCGMHEEWVRQRPGEPKDEWVVTVRGAIGIEWDEKKWKKK
jgi:hypothetical protein